MEEQQKVYPGKNPNFRIDHFSPEEQIIISKLSSEFYFTFGGGILNLGTTSQYKYCLIKPTTNYTDLFNIEKEIIIIFSDFDNFEPRTLDAIDAAEKSIQQFRIEKICAILISKDTNIEKRIEALLRSEPECQIIIPFNYKELSTHHDDYFIRNRFKKYFFSRDLFAYNSPLKKDLFFFGRNDLIHKIVSRHKSGENSGLFGLRKTGKTSIIFGIQRNIKRINGVSVFIDCQNPSFHKKRWNEALYYVITEIKTQNKLHLTLRNLDKYSESNASECFEKDLIKLHKKANSKSIMIIFDEIEHITPNISLSKHWSTDNDFILFWQTLRSIYQKTSNLFTYLIVGTNPKCVEISSINDIDNPIYNQVPYEYINPFSVSDTRTMVRTLSR
ncbi:MAG TPA: hypothetical protein PLD62_02750, partial [Candidatus Cloacimonadota bacterium]|nr:hypothetical protein [Candidatus Cloacimonadota bacterium]